MSAIFGYVAALNGSARAVDREFSQAARAADGIVRVGRTPEPDTVSVSAEALARTREQEQADGGGLERPMIDLRVARYAAIAELQVVRTADEAAKVASGIVGGDDSSRG